MATQAAEPRGDTISVGRVLSRGFSVIAANPMVIVGIALGLGAVPGVALAAISQSLDGSGGAAAVTFGAVTSATSLVSAVLSLVVHAALIRATVAQIDDRPAGAVECLIMALRVLLPLIVLSIVVFLCTMFGLTLFFVPGIMVYVIWSVASPALVEERDGIGAALGRSRELTKGARWPVFGLQLIILIAYFGVAGSLGAGAIAGTGVGALPLSIGWVIANAVVTSLASMVWSTVQAALYVELRDWKDGPTADRLAEVFA